LFNGEWRIILSLQFSDCVNSGISSLFRHDSTIATLPYFLFRGINDSTHKFCGCIRCNFCLHQVHTIVTHGRNT
jgi:hypothetical protein